MYHGFTEKSESTGIENYQGKCLPIGKFRQQMMHVKEHYNALSLDELIQSLNEKKKLPAYSVFITMDDGYESNYSLAYPILKEMNIPAAIFIATDFVYKRKMLWSDRIEYALNTSPRNECSINFGGKERVYRLSNDQLKIQCSDDVRTEMKKIRQETRDTIIENIENSLGVRLENNEKSPAIYRPLTPQQVLEMDKSGLIRIGSHTCSHFILSLCDAETIQKELVESKGIIEKETGHECRYFCYPIGGDGKYNSATRQALVEAGYQCGITTSAGMNDTSADIFQLKRLHVGKDLDEFKAILSQFFSVVFALRRCLP